MCGISGIVRKEIQIEQKRIESMTAAMNHRGPDDSGIIIRNDDNKNLSVGLGHARLSILDLSLAGRQPMTNEDSTLWLTFNGEIYNYPDLKTDLKKKGHTFRSHTDSEIILHLYEEYGEDCLSYLNGMFAFALWDEKKASLFLARDRVGKKPLLYYKAEKVFLFASEFQALLASGLVPKEANKDAIDQFLTFGYIPAPDTAFKGVFKLPPGHYLLFKEGKVTIRQYWQIDYSNKIPISFDAACERVMDLFTDAVKIRMASDVPLGAFLSGGIDSSAVVAVMSQLSTKKIKTFSIGFKEDAYNELSYAKMMADRYGTEHHEFIVEPDALEVLPLLVENYGEPYADSSAIPTYYLSKLTKQHVTVVLNGDGGDEVFAGYERYLAMSLAEQYQKIPSSVRRFLFQPLYKQIPDSIDPKNRWRRLRRFLEGAEFPASERYLRWVGIFKENDKKNIYSPDMMNRMQGNGAFHDLFSSTNNGGPISLLDRLLHTDTLTYLPSDLLVKVDIASMANSLEARSPFLDYRLIEYVASLPPEYKIKGRTLKYLLKKMVKDILPERNIVRRKMGFGVPIRLWFRNELKDFLRDTLFSSQAKNRGYFLFPPIEKLVNNHITGKEDNSYHLWSLLMLELWQRRFIDLKPESRTFG